MSSAGPPQDAHSKRTINTATSIDALPDAALDHVLSFLSGDAQSTASALLVGKRWRAAAERAAVLPDVVLAEDKLTAIQEAGQEQALLAFLARKSRAVLQWLQLRVPAGLETLLPEMLRSLSGGALQGLWLWTQGGIPQELGTLTSLKMLRVEGVDKHGAPPRQIQIPASALSRLTGLVSLAMFFVAGDLTDDHLAGCTALRELHLNNIRLSMSTAAALGAWQHLRHLRLLLTQPRGPAPVDYGYWAAVRQLARLFEVRVFDVIDGPQSSHVRAALAGCSSLVSLHLENYSEPELPAPLPSLTRLYVFGSDALEALPPGGALPNLRSLDLFQSPAEMPLSFSTLTRLTAVRLRGSSPHQMRPALLSLPRIKELDLTFNGLQWLPGGSYLASLEDLNLDYNALAGVPPVLCAATRLTQLDLCHNLDLCLTREGLEVLRALPRLQMLRVQELAEGLEHELSWAELREALPGLEVAVVAGGAE